ncbi:MAG TPA: cyclopropane-fatty-acyl-phospholipid synthase family protein, partial [Nocardioides sp.]|nr:cyclopropane-fatty-acyl-phospholipid synthase family protein [Nocardioides sp.]
MSVKIAPAIESLFDGGLPLQLTAYDGSSAGPTDTGHSIELVRPRGLAYILTAPGDLGLARAYVAGDLVLHGSHPGNPYEPFSLLKSHTDFGTPRPSQIADLVRALGIRNLLPPAPPPQEHLPGWRLRVEALRTNVMDALTGWGRHSQERDAAAIHHHYDVSNTFYEHVLGPSMTYTCAVYPTPDATLEEAQAHKYDLVCRKLDLQPGQRLLDIGCGWGGMVRHAAKEYGVKALGVTLSKEQAEWAQKKIADEGLSDLAEVRFLDYRHVTETDFDAVSAIGIAEHIGRDQMAAYFAFAYSKVKPGGRFLNHCITRWQTQQPAIDKGGFVDRYVFPDGELSAPGPLATHMHDAGFEVRHLEDLREHYALTCAAWCRNLEANWDEAVA